MFTGIIEEVGIVQGLANFSGGCKISIAAKKVIENVEIGASIAVNGACLSVTQLFDNGFQAQAVQETLDKSNLKYLKKQDRVNLERPLGTGARFDGHIVQGHVDGTGQFIAKQERGESAIIKIKLPKGMEQYVVSKGSIAVNGASLTVAEIENRMVSIAVIPITLKDTNLGDLKRGQEVNIEVDILAKYVEKNIKNAYTNSDIKKNLKKWGY